DREHGVGLEQAFRRGEPIPHHGLRDKDKASRRIATGMPLRPCARPGADLFESRTMTASAAGRAPGRREFVLLIAALMASNALAIDSMLPALPAIGSALDVTEENRRQLVISFYMFGFGLAQLAYGPLADRFGRKRLLVICLSAYATFALLSGLAGSFTLLL